jgi:hypothetical protein
MADTSGWRGTKVCHDLKGIGLLQEACENINEVLAGCFRS